MSAANSAGLVERLRSVMTAPNDTPTWVRIACDDAASDLEAKDAEIASLQAKLREREERLEITHHYVLSGNGEDLVRAEIPPEERDNEPDGIECRDATIKGLEATVASLQARIEALVGERDRAAEDERDRLLALAEAQQERIEAITDRRITSAEDQEWCDAVEAGCFLEDHGAMLPADRAASRSQEPPHGR
ncbi:hypothetical protein [Aureimonas sp. ME7]|uniref:hypothetical protein n=1 Tax=Aureimonas sp. ME7 TaxID=2744252 RepID=UPI0015FE6433|nr:hypothetical protein [Aureimonas sp. ME7]